MINSIYKLSVETWFRILTTKDLSLLGGFKHQQIKAWDNICNQIKDITENPKQKESEQIHKRFLKLRIDYIRMYGFLAVLCRKESPESMDVLLKMGVINKSDTRETAIQKLRMRVNGRVEQLESLDISSDKKDVTMKDCGKELAMVQNYFPSISLHSSVFEYISSLNLIYKIHADSDNRKHTSKRL